MKLLIVEDDPEISEMLKDFLITENFEADTAHDGAEACSMFESVSYNLVLLDLMIPKISGMEVLQRIRRKSVVPVIIISAKDSDSDKTLGLGLGADDYITKPFSVTEALARIKANLRRSNQYAAAALGRSEDNNSSIAYGELVLNPDDYTVLKNGRSVELTAKEFGILKLLLQNPKKVYTKAQIYSLIWNDAYCGDENAVNVHMSRLRTKIEDNPRTPKYIVTVWGIGYKLGEIK